MFFFFLNSSLVPKELKLRLKKRNSEEIWGKYSCETVFRSLFKLTARNNSTYSNIYSN